MPLLDDDSTMYEEDLELFDMLENGITSEYGLLDIDEFDVEESSIDLDLFALDDVEMQVDTQMVGEVSCQPPQRNADEASTNTGSRPLARPPFAETEGEVRRKISQVMAGLHSQLASGETLSLSIPNIKDGKGAIGPQSASQSSITTFPGNSGESWRFTVLITILDRISEALRAGVIFSKRDLFYHYPALFGSQATIDRHIDLIAAAFGVRRADLGVDAAAKGLITGAVEFHFTDGSECNLSHDTIPKLVPSIADLIFTSLNAARVVIVVEKEASFREVLASRTWQSLKGKAIALTAKGYPDLATRHLLHALTSPDPFNRFADPAVYILTDFDPDGIAIANTYRFGSLTLAHEGDETKTPKAKRLGLTREHAAGATSFKSVPMTVRDRRKAKSMLTRMMDDSMMVEDVVDLQLMLMLNIKAELQILNEESDGLDSLLAPLITL